MHPNLATQHTTVCLGSKHAHTHTCTCTHVRAHAHTHAHTHKHTHIPTHTHTQLQTNTHIFGKAIFRNQVWLNIWKHESIAMKCNTKQTSMHIILHYVHIYVQYIVSAVSCVTWLSMYTEQLISTLMIPCTYKCVSVHLSCLSWIPVWIGCLLLIIVS